MDEKIFQDYMNAERIEMLDANCDKVVHGMHYTVFLTENELTERKEELSRISIREAEVLEEKKNTVSDFNETLKTINDEKSVLIGEIKHKSKSESGTCYKIVEGDMVGFYNQQGILIHHRPADENERQLTIGSAMRKAASNE